MTLPILHPNMVLYIPRQGMYRVAEISKQQVGETSMEVANLAHLYSANTSRQARSGLERSNARSPTSHQVAYDVVQLMRRPSRRQLIGPWHKQKSNLEDRLKIGTLEKNVEVLRMLHRIDQDRWKTARVFFYQHVLDQVTEELAFIFAEPREQVRRTVIATLNNTAFAHL